MSAAVGSTMFEGLEPAVAGARAALGDYGQIVGTGDAPRYELFHGANSICSQKVRTVLAHHGLPYLGQTVNMFQGQTYLPGYVRLRMLGCDRLGGELVAYHTGSTSSAAGGCDGAVVPTLVDWKTGEVVVDSKRVCIYLDEQMPEASRLRPDHLAAAIDEQLVIVDNIPNYQLLMGRTPTSSESSETQGGTGGLFSRRKVAWCDRYLEEHAGEPVLVRAYTAKRAKELSAAEELFSPEKMRAASDRAKESLHGLEAKLAGRAGTWLHGEAVTMSDLFWGVELLRMKNMGVATVWEGGRLPEVERFLAAAKALPAIRTAILEWPGAMF